MTTLTRPALGARLSTRTLARLCIAAGVLGAVSGLLLAVAPAAVEDTRYSYPFGADAFAAVQVWFAVHHLGLLAGLVALGRVIPGGGGRGLRLAIAGMVMLSATELLAVTAAHSPYPDGWRTGMLDAAYGVSTLAIAAGLIVVGAAVARTHPWTGWSRRVPLATGVYAIVPMTPAMFAGFLPARLAITGWMVMFALLGWAVDRERSR